MTWRRLLRMCDPRLNERWHAVRSIRLRRKADRLSKKASRLNASARFATTEHDADEYRRRALVCMCQAMSARMFSRDG